MLLMSKSVTAYLLYLVIIFEPCLYGVSVQDTSKNGEPKSYVMTVKKQQHQL